MITSVRDEYESGEWLDATSAGSSFEVQLNQRNGQWRHRPRHFGANASVEEEWRAGQPKKGSKDV